MRVRNLNEIYLLHRPKESQVDKNQFQPAHYGVDARISSPHIYLETCLREIWIVYSDQSELIQSWAAKEQIEIYRGAEAFSLSLKIASGLKSAIIGETEIFGQFKKAWTHVSETRPLVREHLGKWMMALFEDTKAIRTKFLQGKGGSSYGTLLRRLLKLKDGEKVLILGAGQLSHGIIPYFDHQSIRIWNRGQARLNTLKIDLEKELNLSQFKSITFTSEIDMSWPDQVIVCIPGVTKEVSAFFVEHQKRPQLKMVHLGIHEKKWGQENLPQAIQTLGDLFNLRDKVQEIRDLNVKRAELECIERAMERIPKACEIWTSTFSMPRSARAK